MRVWYFKQACKFDLILGTSDNSIYCTLSRHVTHGYSLSPGIVQSTCAIFEITSDQAKSNKRQRWPQVNRNEGDTRENATACSKAEGKASRDTTLG